MIYFQHSPLHGFQGKYPSRLFGDLGRTKSFHQNGESIQPEAYDNDGSDDDIVSKNVKPFNNNPPLRPTQRY